MTKFKIFASVILSSIVFMIEYPPEIITSNIGKWLVFFGAEASNIPAWIHSSVFHNSLLLFCIIFLSYVVFSEKMWKYLFSKTKFNKTNMLQSIKSKRLDYLFQKQTKNALRDIKIFQQLVKKRKKD